MTYTGHIEHELPSRIRIKIEAEHADEDFLAGLVKDLSAVPDILEVRANPRANSVTVRSDPKKGPIRTVLKNAGLEVADRSPKKARKPRREEDEFDPHHALALGLSALGLLQVVEGEATGSASESFWNAYRSHTHLNRPLVAIVLTAIGVIQFARGQYLNSASALMFYALTAKHIGHERRLARAKRPSGRKKRRAAAPLRRDRVAHDAGVVVH